jgi:HPt (histidine-containing phosphotransfer) domain-containing protein
MDEYLTKPLQLAALDKALARWLPKADADATGLQARERKGRGKPADSDDEATVDLAALEAVVGDDPGTLRDFLAEFLQTARQQAAEIAAAGDRNDHARVGSVAHKLKAASRSIGAMTLGDLCAELENASKAGGKSEVDRVRVDFDRVARAVDARIVAMLAAQTA